MNYYLMQLALNRSGRHQLKEAEAKAKKEAREAQKADRAKLREETSKTNAKLVRGLALTRFLHDHY